MALQKTVTTANGVSANYHRIGSLSMNVDSSVMIIELKTYVDSAARSGGSDPVELHTLEVSETDFTTYFAPSVLDLVNQNPQERAYEWLKTQTTPVDFTVGTTDV